jgi:hypothetical protein
MATTSEILKTADLLVKEHGEMAPVGARIKADQLLEIGDDSGRRTWLKIAKAAEKLLSEDPAGTQTVH